MVKAFWQVGESGEVGDPPLVTTDYLFTAIAIAVGFNKGEEGVICGNKWNFTDFTAFTAQAIALQ